MGERETVQATNVPMVIMKAAVGEEEGSAEFPGIVLDKQSIINIKRYEARGMSLPSTYDEVTAWIGGVSDVPELTNNDLLAVYRMVRSHAVSWSPLENDILQTSINMEQFGSYVKEKGDFTIGQMKALVGKYGDIDWSEYSSEKLTNPEVVKKLLEKIQDKPLDWNEDVTTLSVIAVVVNKMAHESESYHAATIVLQTRLQRFKDRLRDCRGVIEQKEVICGRRQTEEANEHRDLVQQRDAMRAKINTASQEYDKDVALACAGAWWGPIGVAITGSIFGTKAAAIRKQINAWREHLDNLMEQLNHLDEMIRAVSFMLGDFHGLEIVMINAQKGVLQLLEVWKNITTWLTRAAKAAKDVKSTHSMIEYWIDFADIVSPWKKTIQYAGALVKVLQQGIEESRRRLNVINVGVIGGYPMRPIFLAARLPICSPQALSVSDADFPVIDIQTASDVTAQITDLYNSIDPKNFPHHYTYITDINKYCNQGLDHLRSSIITVREYSDVPESLKMINPIIKNLVKQIEAEKDETEVAMLKKRLERYHNIGQKSVSDIISTISSEKDALVSIQHDIGATDFGSELQRYAKEIADRMTTAENNIKHSDEKMKEAEKNEKTLRLALALMLRDNIFTKLGNSIIPTDDEMTAILEGMAQPEVALILASLHLLRLIATIIGDELSDKHMQTAIDYYATIADDYRMDLAKYNAELCDLHFKAKDITSMQAIDTKRSVLIDVMQKAIQMFAKYGSMLLGYVKEDADFDRIMELMDAVKELLTEA